jgi:hypothetical protein
MSTKKTTKTKAQAKPAKKQAKAPATDANGKVKKVSALDAAARVLAEAKQPMNCQALIEAMAAKGYWRSPNGKTPHSTLYAAIAREITAKGKDARFRKTDRGQFAANA